MKLDNLLAQLVRPIFKKIDERTLIKWNTMNQKEQLVRSIVFGICVSFKKDDILHL